MRCCQAATHTGACPGWLREPYEDSVGHQSGVWGVWGGGSALLESPSCLTPHFSPGHCLLDKPEAPLHLPATFPGKDYSADRQCQLTFGPDSHHCSQLLPPCAALWCSGYINGQAMCQTKHSPWADGTPCGPAMACMGGQCLQGHQLQDFNVSVAWENITRSRHDGPGPEWP